MPWISEEQKKAAKEVDLLCYLQLNEPHELVKLRYGTDEYRTKTHGSLVISNGRWFWNRGNTGGRTALDFLIKVRGMSFVDAVETVLGENTPVDLPDAPTYATGYLPVLPVRETKQTPPKAKLHLPEAALLPANAVFYLQKRGISSKVINCCLAKNILYESSKYQNIVFVGRDEKGIPRFACKRGTRGDLKADVFGSDKKYSFSVCAEDSDSTHLVVFESPIDLLSHMTLQERDSSAHVRYEVAKVHRLSLGGTSDVALMAYLKRNPKIEKVTLCLDSDEAGQTAAMKIISKLAADNQYKHINVINSPPQGGAKDYNDVLLRTINAEREQKQHTKQPGRREAAL